MRCIGPLSLWESVRVRAFQRRAAFLGWVVSRCPHPLPLSQRERGASRTASYSKRVGKSLADGLGYDVCAAFQSQRKTTSRRA